jgi:hypothetical protein
VETLTLILTALAAGATGGALDVLQGDVAEKAKAAYAKVHDLVQRRLKDQPHGELALAQYPAEPQAWEGLLRSELTKASAADDTDLLAAAKALMKLMDPPGALSAKCGVTVNDSTGVMVGDGNIQFNKL